MVRGSQCYVCGPDEPRSWLVALAGSAVMSCITWTFRCSGVMYVAFLDEFHMSREQASWPVSLFSVSSCMTGPVAGLLVHYFTMRTLCIWATLLGFAAVAMCQFASSILEISIWLGAIQGICMSFHYTLTSPLVASYFDRHVTTAIGILYTGPAIGSFAFIPLFNWSYKEYGLHGSFLIFSGVVLNALPFLLLMRDRCTDSTACNIELITIRSNGEQPKQELCYESCKINNAPNHLQDTEDIMGDAMSVVAKASFVFKQPMFYVIGVSNIVVGYCNTTVLSVIMDFALDQGVPERTAVVLLNVVAVGDLVGRLCSGWITDHGYLSRNKMMVIEYFLLATLLVGLAHLKGTTALMVVMLVFACVAGSTVVLFTNIIKDYLGSEWIALSSGWMTFFGGWVLLSRPALVGYFRDKLGSYVTMFTFLGASCFLCSGLWCAVTTYEYWRVPKDSKHEPQSNTMT
ncbi:monocarboxylate transporter, putative [Ixodes scapularis]|uniref:Monocarboxylate transporter, putative n=1 Tax=Ixodes scapularis TaxID=6945 RepID=B7QEA9_IXOSC|nr:monocarboxylate transporter, putative [Ixodes scapularis]|eukprot:XP_002413873.1 monocarboxylate transporter, putative [Ixodes scapularis]